MGIAYIVDAVRTPRGRGKQGGALHPIHPQQLLAEALRGLEERVSFHTADVEDVVAGCVQQIGEQGACIARNSVLLAGWPDVVTGVTLNRFCGSGLQAVNFALMGVASGMQDLVVGGGVESMSRVPMGSDGGGLHGKNVDLLERVPIVPQGISADLIATREGFTREQCDRFAWESQQNTQRAVAERRYRSIVPVRDNDGSTVLERDEYPRPETSLDGLAQLKPSFAPAADYVPPGEDGLSLLQRVQKRYPDVERLDHVHTAGNSSGIVDGASAVLIASERYVRDHGLKPRAKVLATATCGAEPVIMLTAPGPASERALAKAGMQKGDVDLWEINEAFAAIPLKVMRDLDVPRDRVNVNGGAIALGHPLGATGGMLIGTLLDELERSDRTIGLATLCIGGGMGIATIVERVS